MSHEYYVVYSTQTAKGTAIGRTQIKCEVPMNTMDRVEEIEKKILECLHRGKEPSASSLFLTWWHPLTEIG